MRPRRERGSIIKKDYSIKMATSNRTVSSVISHPSIATRPRTAM